MGHEKWGKNIPEKERECSCDKVFVSLVGVLRMDRVRNDGVRIGELV